LSIVGRRHGVVIIRVLCWLLIPVGIVAAFVFVVAAVVIPIAAARRVQAAEARLVRAQKQIARAKAPPVQGDDARSICRQPIKRPEPVLIDHTAIGLRPAAAVATKWQYKLLYNATEEQLNAAGEKGSDWQTTVIKPADGPGGASVLVTILKRPVHADVTAPLVPPGRDGKPQPTEPRSQ
jgi:hypothetical protein